MEDDQPRAIALPKEWECVCEHHWLYHDSWGKCLTEDCGCKGYVDGPAAYELGRHPKQLEIKGGS